MGPVERCKCGKAARPMALTFVRVFVCPACGLLCRAQDADKVIDEIEALGTRRAIKTTTLKRAA